jgi:DNA-binding GntR family transcriptional regulator
MIGSAREDFGDDLGTLNPGNSAQSKSALRRRVYGQLAAAIRAGKFAPGEQVTIRGLAELLGTSTMPVREAVTRLVSERALEVLPNRSMRIPPLSRERLEELTHVRCALEGHAAALAAKFVTPAEFTVIREANERYGRAHDCGDLRSTLSANEDFHFATYRAARSPLLVSMIELLWLQSGPYLEESIKLMIGHEDPNEFSVGVAYHFELLAALAKNDEEMARRALVGDIDAAAKAYIARIFKQQSKHPGTSGP